MSLGAYESETARGSVLNALAHPSVVNPVAAITQGVQAANAIYGIRQQQANQAIGRILQQATDANGNVDYGKANALAAQAGPVVQMGMSDMLRRNSELLGQQQQNAMRHMSLIGGASLDLMNSATDADLDRVQTSLLNAGVPQAVVNQEITTMRGMSEADRKQYAYQHGIAAMNPDTAMARVGGQTQPQDFGDRIGGLNVTQPSPRGPGGVAVTSGAATVSMTPAQAAQPYKYTDSTGREQSTTVGEHLRSLGVNVQIGGQAITGRTSSTTPGKPPPPPSGTTVTTPTTNTSQPAATPGVQYGNPNAPQAVPPPPGAPAGTTSGTYTGGGIGTVLGPRSQNFVPSGPQIASNALIAPAVGAVTPPSPAVAGDVSAILGGMRGSPANALTGGAATAGPGAPPAQPGWGTTQGGQPFIGSYGAPATAAPPPPVVRQPTAPVAGTGASVSPPGGRSISGPAPGLTDAAKSTATQSATMGNALVARGDQAPMNKANYANMLDDLQRINNMPPGGEKEIAINTFLQKALGFGLTMSADQVAAANSFAKLANIAVGQQLAAIGGTDARQALFMGSNPNLDLSKLGNTQIIHMLQGNEDAIQAKARAWNDWLTAGNGSDTYGQFQNDFNHHFDPRVFQSQYMSPDEIATLRKGMTGPDGKTNGEGRKFLEDVAYARDHGWIK